MDHFLSEQRARTLIIFHHEDEIIGADSWNLHSVCKRLKASSYQVRTWTISSEACGAALWNQHLVTVATLCQNVGVEYFPLEQVSIFLLVPVKTHCKNTRSAHLAMPPSP